MSFLALGACAKKAEVATVKDCVLPDDQLGTLLGKWKATPVPIAFHQGDFSTGEMNEIIAAANTWNSFYTTSIGMAGTIDYGSAANPRVSTVARPSASILCSSGIVAGSSYTGQVVLYKNGVWPFSNTNAMALTSHCRTAATPLPYYFMATVDFNYQNFFISGKPLPDLQTIILHEFGHLVGLNHSCEGTAKTGVPFCSAPNINADYVSAVMFPNFSFSNGYGEQKRALQANDQGRANCLYMNF